MGILGHDLRNPLGAVLGFSKLSLSEGGLPDKVRDHLQRIDRAAQRMKELIETLSDVTRTRFGGGLPISREPVDLRDVAARVVDELRAATPGREVRLDAGGDVRGQWDPARLAQLLSNLVGNALTHGAQDTAVDVKLMGEDGYVTMEVTNRGPAIPAELIDRLFEPFWQAKAVRESGRSHGLGLGLFIARQVVLAHGGTIAVRSNDEATTFAVRLERAPRT
jgi:signal transduction histidine kinase